MDSTNNASNSHGSADTHPAPLIESSTPGYALPPVLGRHDLASNSDNVKPFPASNNRFDVARGPYSPQTYMGAREGVHGVTYQPADAEPYINALVAEDGNVHAAAEGCRLSVSEFIAVIASDPYAQPKLEQRLRILATLKLFSTINTVHARLKEVVGELDAKDAARNFGNMVEIIERMTRNVAPPEGTTFEKLLEGLPQHVREAVLTVASVPAPPEQIVSAHALGEDDDD